MKNPKILKFDPDCFKTKKMCKHAVKKLLDQFRCVPYQCKTQKLCNKVILENSGTLMSVSDCYRNLLHKGDDNYHHALEFASEFFITQEGCDKVVNTHSSTIQFVPECYKTQKYVINLLINLPLIFLILLIDIKLKKCVTEFFLMILFQ